MHNTLPRPCLRNKKENVLASGSHDGGSDPYAILLVLSTFWNLLIVQQSKSQIVPTRDAPAARTTSNRVAIPLPTPLASKRGYGLTGTAQLGSMSSFSCSFYRDDAAGEIEPANRAFGRTRRSRHLSQCRERLLRAAGQGPRPARPDHGSRPCRDDLCRRIRSGERRLDQRSAAPPTTIGGIEKYLGSGMVRGIGSVCPNVECIFDETVFDIRVAKPIAIESRP